MLDIMTSQQFEQAYHQALKRASKVEERQKETLHEDQQASIERQMNYILNNWLLNPHNYEKATLKCPIILKEKMASHFAERLKQMGWKIQNNGYDKYEGGYSYTVMKK